MNIRKNFCFKKAFTLIELLAVIFIITLIATTVFFSISNSRQRGKDVKRISDITQIQAALDNYRRIEGRYPEQLIFGEALIGSSSGMVFMSRVPTNYSYDNDDCVFSNYNYFYNDENEDYELSFCLENPIENYSAGIKCANSKGILNDFCSVLSYTLSYSAGAGGSISGNASQSVEYGLNGTEVTAIAETGYSFVKWSDDSTSNPRVDNNVTKNISVTAQFSINQYALNYSAGSGGSISGNTSQLVEHGSSGTAVTANPSTGYSFVKWSDDSTSNPRTDSNVTGSVSVVAEFAGSQFAFYYSGDLLNDLKTYWKMEEASGDTLLNETSSFNGTLSGTTKPTRVNAKIGKGLEFSDVTTTLNHVSTSILGSNDWRGSNSYTVSLWVYLNWSNSGTGFDRIITKGGSSSASVVDFVIQQDHVNNKIAFYQASGTTYYNVISGTLNKSQWYHVMAMWDGSKIELFIDNVSQGTSNVASINNNSTRKLLLGAIHDGTSTTNLQSSTLLNGRIDEVAIWSRALSADERLAVYNSGSGITHPFSVVQQFVVPVTGTYRITAIGAKGGDSGNGNAGGAGGQAIGERTFQQGDILYVYVGGQGLLQYFPGQPGGWNGGGKAFSTLNSTAAGRPGTGGGASDVRLNGTALTDRIIVGAGGGGAAGNSSGRIGGAGGGLTGESPSGGSGGAGGTQSAGGNNNGALGQGGDPATDTRASGGGGYYGGGSARSNYYGGGGGSSYIGGLSNASTTQGVNSSGHGSVIIEFIP